MSLGICFVISCKKEPEPFVYTKPNNYNFVVPTINSVPQINYIRAEYMRTCITDSSGSTYVKDTSYLSVNKRKYSSQFTSMAYGYYMANIYYGDLDCGLDTLPDSTSFRNFFAPGAKVFTHDSIAGIRIDIFIDSGEHSTLNTSQDGSSFIIDEIQEDIIGGIQRVKILGRFNCKVAKSDGSDVIPLTSGTLVAYFRNK